MYYGRRPGANQLKIRRYLKRAGAKLVLTCGQAQNMNAGFDQRRKIGVSSDGGRFCSKRRYMSLIARRHRQATQSDNHLRAENELWFHANSSWILLFIALGLV